MPPSSAQSEGVSAGAASRRDHVVADVKDEDHIGQLIASLWEHAPFPRLPDDAPAELLEYISEIENPRRVYAIHRALRRHGCQLLIEKFIVQLRQGCDSKSCSTPTCFTYRKRAARDTPIRRYNTTSARALAVYMAGLDNPESALCPHLPTPKGPPASMQSLSFVPRQPVQRHQRRNSGDVVTDNQPARPGGIKGKAPSVTSPRNGNAFYRHGSSPNSPPPQARITVVHSPCRSSTSVSESHDRAEPGFDVTEEPVRKDPRSFVANVFGTVAFKMMEWLSPHGIEHMHAKAVEAMADAAPRAAENCAKPLAPRPSVDRDQPDDVVNGSAVNATHLANGTDSRDITGRSCAKVAPRRRDSSATVRTPSGHKARRKLSLEPFPAPKEDTSLSKAGLTSPLVATVPPEERRPRRSTATSSGELATEPLTFDVSVEVAQQPGPTSADPGLAMASGDSGNTDNGTPGAHLSSAHNPRRASKATPKKTLQISPGTGGTDAPVSTKPDCPSTDKSEQNEDGVKLPQSVSHLTTGLVEFFHDILQEDGTFEGALYDDWTPDDQLVLRDPPQRLQRLERPGRHVDARLGNEWRMFVEQGLFGVLSDARPLIRSFTEDGLLLDSAMVWYRLSRLTRMMPSVVLDSLWIASARLFSPPKCLQTARSATSRRSRRPSHGRPLSNAEASQLMTICFHALVAAVPFATSPSSSARGPRFILSVSHVLNSGQTGVSSRRATPAALKHQINCHDVYSNPLALRLAKRLFTSLAARKYYAELVEMDDSVPDTAADFDVVTQLMSHVRKSQSSSYLTTGPTNDYVYHLMVREILRDWVWAVLMDEWDGQAEFSSDGSFGGAVLFMKNMYQECAASKASEDALFRGSYFAERLDPTVLPMSWLSFEPSRRRQHLLDHQFLFTNGSLVTYFRVINLSRMTEHYIMAKNYFARCAGLDESSTMFTNRYRDVLKDLIRTASASYLVLEISRENFLEDAFDQLWRREERELIRPLKVLLGQHEGEEGADLGGVQQEFFRLAIGQCLDPAYGAFSLDETTRMQWFQPGSVVELWKYEMIGLLFSLAVFNGLTLPVTFPLALYRKLLRQPVNEIKHIEDGWRHLASGLETLAKWNEAEGLVEDVFARTYEFSIEAFGEVVSRNMRSKCFESWPAVASVVSVPSQNNSTAKAGTDGPASAENPTDVPVVTSENREAYVADYVDWLTNVSVAAQYSAFERGFNVCLHPKSLELLTPPLLQNLVEGVQKIDMAELRQHAQHVAWNRGDRSPGFFWAVVSRYDDDMKRKLLEFVTASGRVPVGGMNSIRFVLQKNGEYVNGEVPRLPTAYTCYGILLLPEYESEAVLEERLKTALENRQGFGFA